MSDTGYISVDIEQSEYDAAQIESAAAFFKLDSLSPRDDNTTIVANDNLHCRFEEAQDLIVLLGQAMDKEVGNIRSVGMTFEEYDNMLADLANKTTE